MDFSSVGKKKVTRIDAKVPQLVATLDLAAAKEEFTGYLEAIDGIVEQATGHEVKDEDTAQYAVSMTKEVRDIEKKIEDKRKELVKDPNEFVKSVNAFAKMFTGKLNTAETTLKHKIGQYQYKIELERRKAEEEARKAAEELQRKLQAEADEANRKAREEAAKKAEEEARARKASEAEIEAAKKAAEEEAKKHEIEAPAVVAPVLPQEKRITRTESGASAHIRKEWKAEVVDVEKVPRAFCSPDMTLIKQAVKMGVREIPGVKVYEAPITVIR